VEPGRWTCDLEPPRMHQLQGVCADSPPKKRGSTNTYLNLFSLQACMDQNCAESPLS
jgi:hypothetical protein